MEPAHLLCTNMCATTYPHLLGKDWLIFTVPKVCPQTLGLGTLSHLVLFWRTRWVVFRVIGTRWNKPTVSLMNR